MDNGYQAVQVKNAYSILLSIYQEIYVNTAFYINTTSSKFLSEDARDR